MARPMLLDARDLPTAWKILVPEYKSRQYSPLVLQIQHWDDSYAHRIYDISSKRAENRVANYLVPKEIERVKSRLSSKSESSIRFGMRKEGHGYHGERGDFCLVGGAIDGSKLTLFYRSLELIGGFAYDIWLIHALAQKLGINFTRLQVLAAHANVFALKLNSNEKLYPKLWEIFSE